MQDEIEIEVFRAGTRASRGITIEDIKPLEEFDCDANPVGCVIGHPQSDSPSLGNIRGFRVEGNALFAKLSGLKDELVDGIRDHSLINRSMAFFPADHEANPTPGKLAPRHLGFLGSSAPGIPGMKPLKAAFSFDASDDLVIDEAPAEAVIFEAPTPVLTIAEEKPTMTPEEIEAARLRAEKLAADEKAHADSVAAFNARVETANKAKAKAHVATILAAKKILPADVPALELVFGALDSETELEFSADDKGFAGDKLLAIMLKGPDVEPAKGDRQISPDTARKGEFAATGDSAKDAKVMTKLARERMEADKSLTFEAALELVQEEGE